MSKQTLLYFISVAITFTSCYKEKTLVKETNDFSVFEFDMSEQQENSIYSTLGVEFNIEPSPVLRLGTSTFDLDRFTIRGVSTLNFRRKSFSVNLDKYHLLLHNKNKAYFVEEFKLLSLVFDYTYTENLIAINICDALQMYPLINFLTEVKINNNTQGLYLFIEDPEDHFINQHHSNFILRRGYNHNIRKWQISPSALDSNTESYINKFKSIYTIIADYAGEELYNRLANVLDLEAYFTKMAIDYILKNGDSTDELYLYTTIKNGKEIFSIYSWDYDDLFANKPHEVNRDWAVGKVFGERTYATIEEVEQITNGTYIYTIEDDLDYKIATDSFMLKKYKRNFLNVLDIINEELITNIFITIESQLTPYYNNPEIIKQSVYDKDETNYQLFQENIEEKKTFLIDRIQETKTALLNENL